jgi:hypothetical protein
MSYKTPFATTTDWGIVRVGSGLSVTDGVISTTGGASLNYGFFYDTTSQTNPVINTPNLVTFNTIGSSNQVTVVGSQVTVVNAGTYNIVFTLSLEKTSSGSPVDASFWLRYNGVDLSNSRQDLAVPNQVALNFVTGSYTQAMAAGSNIELVWSSAGPTIQLSALPAAVGPIRPATPSTKITLTRIS